MTAGGQKGFGVPPGPSVPGAEPDARERRGHGGLGLHAPHQTDHGAPQSGRVDRSGTRERILAIALDLFVEQGYEETSLRQIAERVGVTKAALYYHFRSKDEILLTLHEPVHELMRNAMARLENPASGGGMWMTFLDWLIDQVAAHSRLLLMYQRNATALGEVHRKDHRGPEMEPEQIFLSKLRDPALSLDDRVRMAGSLAVVVAGAALAMQPGARAVDPAELAGVLRVAVRDLLRVGPPPPPASPPPPPPA
jgi:AcrR family transcriptional regulator